MKINRFNENFSHLHNIHDNEEDIYGPFANDLLRKFFIKDVISHSELLTDDDGDNFILICEFNCDNITPELLINISDYLKCVNDYGKYEIYAFDGWIGAQVKIYKEKLHKLNPELKIKIDSNKYNL